MKSLANYTKISKISYNLLFHVKFLHVYKYIYVFFTKIYDVFLLII